jgi:hypothetical protein
MLTTSEDTVRDARIYRVNAWREIKGRPALDFTAKVEAWLVFPEADPFRSQADETEPETLDAPEKLTQAKGTRPPEWWTEENTAAWTREVWGDRTEASAAQSGWRGKITDSSPRASAATYTPLKPELMAKWRAADPRPSNVTYFDGAPVTLKPLAVKVKRTRKVATV